MGVRRSKIELRNIRDNLIKHNLFDEEEFANMVMMSTPSIWCQNNLCHPDTPGKPLELQDYQIEYIDNPSNMKALRWGRGCLVGETLVTMADGTTKRLDEVEVDDKVISRSAMGKIVNGKVKRFYENGKQDVYKIELENGDSITATSKHLFWAIKASKKSNKVTNAKWISLETKLTIGDYVATIPKYTNLTLSNISANSIYRWVRISRIQHLGEQQTYDLYIYKYNNYIANNIVVHNSGKTVISVSETLWECDTEPHTQIFYYVPGKSQLERIYTIMNNMLEGSPISDHIDKGGNNKLALQKGDQIEHMINFTNGSRIIFFICSSKAEKIRSHHGGKIIIDEAHYIKEEFITAIMGLLTNIEKPMVVMASTPRGRWGRFYHWCNSPDVFESHVKSEQSRYWTKEKELMARTLCPDNATYEREYNANWAEEADSVYTEKVIADAVLKTQSEFGAFYCKDYKEFNDNYYFFDEDQLWNYAILNRLHHFIGVDWNSPKAGVRVLHLIEMTDGRLVVPKIEKHSYEEYTQLNAVDRILEIYKEYSPKKIMVDLGFGNVQTELIQKHAYDIGDENLKDVFMAIDFTAAISLAENEIHSKRLMRSRAEKLGLVKTKTKTRAKTYMISLIHSALQSGILILPAFLREEEQLLSDMRSFVLESITAAGEPVYSKNGQHDHMALGLAMFGWHIYHKVDKNSALNEPVTITSKTKNLKPKSAMNTITHEAGLEIVKFKNNRSRFGSRSSKRQRSRELGL